MMTVVTSFWYRFQFNSLLYLCRTKWNRVQGGEDRKQLRRRETLQESHAQRGQEERDLCQALSRDCRRDLQLGGVQ